MSALYGEISIPPFLNPDSIRKLSEQINEIEDSDARFIVLKGSADVFCNGLDLRWVAANESGNYLKEMQEYGEFLKKLQTGKCISIAIVEGSVSGGGMGIACACDYVISENSGTYSLPEGMLGLIPGMILPSLLNKLSPRLVKKMVLTGQKYSAATALEWGIVDEVVTKEEMEAALDAVMKVMRACKKDPVGDIKKLLYTSNIDKDELALNGMKILNIKLNQPDIRERLKDIADFME